MKKANAEGVKIPMVTATPAESESKPVAKSQRDGSTRKINSSALKGLGTISVSNALAGSQKKVAQQEEEEDISQGFSKVETQLTKEQMMTSIKKFAEVIRHEHKAFARSIQSRPHVLHENNHVEVILDNEMINDKQLLADLLGFMKTDLKNRQISIAAKVVANQKTFKSFSAKDRYEDMLKINPQLHKFATDLNLTLEF